MLKKRLVKLRTDKGLSQYELAKVLSLSRGQISNYELGTRQPDYETLTKIADFFDVSTDYLLGRTNDPSPRPKINGPSLSNEEKELTELGKLFKKIIGILKDERGALPGMDLLDSEKELNKESEFKSLTADVPKNKTIAAHSDENLNELPPEARKSVDEFIDYIYKKYGK